MKERSTTTTFRIFVLLVPKKEKIFNIVHRIRVEVTGGAATKSQRTVQQMTLFIDANNSFNPRDEQVGYCSKISDGQMASFDKNLFARP